MNLRYFLSNTVFGDDSNSGSGTEPPKTLTQEQVNSLVGKTKAQTEARVKAELTSEFEAKLAAKVGEMEALQGQLEKVKKDLADMEPLKEKAKLYDDTKGKIRQMEIETELIKRGAKPEMVRHTRVLLEAEKVFTDKEISGQDWDKTILPKAQEIYPMAFAPNNGSGGTGGSGTTTKIAPEAKKAVDPVLEAQKRFGA